MEFHYRYHGESQVANTARRTDISFAPDTMRDPTYFIADLRQHIAFREAISALHDVVVSDLRFKPKDRDAYLRWLAQQESTMLAAYMGQSAQNMQKITALRKELDALWDEEQQTLGPYYRARQKYYDYIYQVDYKLWFILDPVITVNPDEVFFECFSEDESSYGRLSCDFDVFHHIKEFACGTTNIDYSTDLYGEFQKIRTYKNTQFRIEPGGFTVQTTHEDEFTEQKIDLPDSWVRGFLQVSSAMGLPATQIDLHPMDMHNFCLLLRRAKEKHGPRSMRLLCKPGQPLRVLFEPWNNIITCPRSIYHGGDEQEIRLWGRRRLLILERLIPVSKKFTWYLLGTGMPSFTVADLGSMRFTLGLSGWTANDWSRLGNFDLMAPRADVDDFTKKRVFTALKETWRESADSLAGRLQLDRDMVLAALAAYTQAGRVIYDLDKGIYRLRELSREPLPMERLRFESEREAKADRFIQAGLVNIEQADHQDKQLRISGTVRDNGHKRKTTIDIDDDQRLVNGRCECSYYVCNKLYKGPCEHMIALRRQFSKSRLNS